MLFRVGQNPFDIVVLHHEVDTTARLQAPHSFDQGAVPIDGKIGKVPAASFRHSADQVTIIRFEASMWPSMRMATLRYRDTHRGRSLAARQPHRFWPAIPRCDPTF